MGFCLCLGEYAWLSGVFWGGMFGFRGCLCLVECLGGLFFG